jgi:hypothetical protein
VNIFIFIFCIISGSFSIHLSGRKSFASSPKIALSRLTTQQFTPIIVFSGIYLPCKVTPPVGTIRSRMRPVLGWIRNASLTTANLMGWNEKFSEFQERHKCSNLQVA